MASLIADPFQAARLVLSLRRQGITDDAVLAALETVDRGAFVDEALSDLGAEDCALPIACGQSILRPIVVARLLRALAPSAGKENRVLVIGAGSGYLPALLSQISRHVFAVERYKALTELSQERLNALAVENVTVRHGDGLMGLPEHGPFDRILLTGAIMTVPKRLFEQLARGGRLVAAVSNASGVQMLRTFEGEVMVSEEPLTETLPLLIEGVAQSL